MNNTQSAEQDFDTEFDSSRVGFFTVPMEKINKQPLLVMTALKKMNFLPLRVETVKNENDVDCMMYLGVSHVFKPLKPDDVKDKAFEVPHYQVEIHLDTDYMDVKHLNEKTTDAAD